MRLQRHARKKPNDEDAEREEKEQGSISFGLPCSIVCLPCEIVNDVMRSMSITSFFFFRALLLLHVDMLISMH